MSKHKLPRKSTNIDMTAMCDVAFLLLTFFMLATKFKPDEPVIVKTPSSTSDIILPDNHILLTVDKEGRVFLDLDNIQAKKILINDVDTAKKLGLTDAEKQSFVNGASFGLPLSQMKTFLGYAPLDQKQFGFTGIPIDTTYVEATNELGYWIQAARRAAVSISPDKNPIICIKSDASTPYLKVRDVIKTLTKNDITTFNLLTSLEAIPPGTELYAEKNK